MRRPSVLQFAVFGNSWHFLRKAAYNPRFDKDWTFVRTGDVVANNHKQGLLTLTLAPALVLVSSAASAEGMALSLTPNLFNVEVSEGERDQPERAHFRSGLGLELRNSLLQVAVDYRVESELTNSAEEALVSQRVGASLYSSALNKMLGLDANISAGSTIEAGGDAWVYSITPGISKSIADLADFSIHYEYLLDNPGSEAAVQEKMGYRMGLNGASQDGRLTWQGKYRTTDVYGGVEQLQSTELLEFETALQLIPELQLQVSGRSMDETRFDGGLASGIYTETRYGAGLAWSPSPFYSVAFKVNRLDESEHAAEEVFGSGTVSWFPQPNLEFTLSYGDHLVEGARGVMLSTKIDLTDS